MTAMTATADQTRAHQLVTELLGPSDPSADRAVAVLNAHACALAWVRDTTGAYPAPASVAAVLDSAAQRLKSGEDPRDPVRVLRRAAEDALAAHRADVAS
jgi:hypothetical protein